MQLLKHLFPRGLSDIARATVFPLDRARSKRQFVLFYFIRLCFIVGQRLWRDKCPRQSAALAFQTMLSLVPLVVVAAAVASTFDLEIFKEKMTVFLQAHLLPGSASAVGRTIVELANSIQLRTLGIVGGATLLVIAMTLLFTVEQVLNEIFRCVHKRSLGRRVLIALMLLIGAPLAFGLSLYFTKELFAVVRILNAGLPLLFTVLALFLCYWLIPHRKVRVFYSFISAVVAGVLLEAAKIGFALYAKYLGITISYVYGAFAILPLFMVWIYIAWLFFLFGAQFNAALHEVRHHNGFTKGS